MVSGWTRRGLMVGGLVAATAGGGLWGLSQGPPRTGARVLTEKEWTVVEAVGDVMFPGIHLPSAAEAEVAAGVDRVIAEVLDPIHASGFRYVLRTLEWGTLASRGRPFTGLSRRARAEVLETWSGPEVLPRRVAGDALKVILGMAYYGHPAVQAAMGWRQGCHAERSDHAS